MKFTTSICIGTGAEEIVFTRWGRAVAFELGGARFWRELYPLASRFVFFRLLPIWGSGLGRSMDWAGTRHGNVSLVLGSES